MKFAKLKSVKAGDILKTDGGFTCMPAGVLRKVHADADGKLWIRCSDGKHYLDGQADGQGCLVGLTAVA
jgi:hypothetical protein